MGSSKIDSFDHQSQLRPFDLDVTLPRTRGERKMEPPSLETLVQ
jgi:hypothetical protein